MGDAPKLDMRRMRAEVAGLPQLVSTEERAEIAAGARVRRSSRPVQQRRQPPPPPAAQRPVHSDGDAWPARSAIFEPSHIDRQPAAEMPAPATAQLQLQPQPQPRQQQGQQQEHEEQPTPEEARRGSAGVSSGESVDSPAAAGGSAGSASGESADGSTATGPSAHSVTSAPRRRHSLADIRRAIAALPRYKDHLGLRLATKACKASIGVLFFDTYASQLSLELGAGVTKHWLNVPDAAVLLVTHTQVRAWTLLRRFWSLLL